jgi:hypothetical protein
MFIYEIVGKLLMTAGMMVVVVAVVMALSMMVVVVMMMRVMLVTMTESDCADDGDGVSRLLMCVAIVYMA